MGSVYIAVLLATSSLLQIDHGFGTDAGIAEAELAFLSVCAEEPESLKPANELARLQQIWNGWKEKATSIEVEGFEFYGVLYDATSQVSPAALRKLIEEDLPKLVHENLQFDRAVLNAVTKDLFPPPPDSKLKTASFGRWADVSMVRAADCVKWSMSLDGGSSTLIRRGPIEQNYSPDNRQVSIYTKNGGLSVPEMQMFVYGPKLSDSTSWKFLETQPTKRELILEGDQGKAVQLDYDPDSGLVRYHGLRFSPTQLHRDRFQSAEVVTKNGVPVPRITTEIYYEPRQPQTRHIKIYVTTAVEVGKEIEQTRFNMSVPIGTNVILFEGAPGDQPPGVRPPMARTKRVIEDAEEFTRSDEFRQAQRR